jgi:outer membrane immunogenic protein
LKKILGLVGAVLLSAGPALAADLPVKAPVRAAPASAVYNWTNCYVGGFLGGAGGSNVDVGEAVSQGGTFAAGTFYNAPNGASYSYRTSASVIGGGTLGCNWEAPGTPIVLGLEGEFGFLRSSVSVADPNSATFGFDTIDRTAIGDWYGVVGGRLGWAVGPALFYAKGGALFTRVNSSITDTCTVAPCGGGTLSATGSNTDVGWAAGGGIEYWFAPQWTVKAEYLFLGLNNQSFAVCGPGGAGAAGSTFCSSHSLGGISTGKVGVNFHF